MDIYICGIHPAYTYDRVCSGYARCYVCFYQSFYVLQMYSRDDSDFETVSQAAKKIPVDNFIHGAKVDDFLLLFDL